MGLEDLLEVPVKVRGKETTEGLTIYRQVFL